MQITPIPDLVPSALSVLHILNTTALFNKVEALKTLCFEIILSYPDETLIDISANHSTELMELLNLYSHQRIPLDIRLQVRDIFLIHSVCMYIKNLEIFDLTLFWVYCGDLID